MFFIILFSPVIIMAFILIYMATGNSESSPEGQSSAKNKRHSAYYDYYDDDWDDDWDDDEYYYGYNHGYEDGLMSSGMLNGAQKTSSTAYKKKEEESWKPLPDYVDSYGYYCPDCDADLFDEHCEHEDDWI